MSFQEKRLSATAIQSFVRMWITKRQYVRIQNERNLAALTIQKNYKMFQARKTLRNLRQENLAAIKIQSAFKSYMQRMAYKEVKARRYQSAVLIQKHWRRCIAIREYRKDYKAIVLIQSLIRRRQARKQFCQLKSEHQAAIKIQCLFRMMHAQSKLKQLRENKAAGIIQKHFRGWKQREEYAKTKHSVIIIQSYMRMIAARRS